MGICRTLIIKGKEYFTYIFSNITQEGIRLLTRIMVFKIIGLSSFIVLFHIYQIYFKVQYIKLIKLILNFTVY